MSKYTWGSPQMNQIFDVKPCKKKGKCDTCPCAEKCRPEIPEEPEPEIQCKSHDTCCIKQWCDQHRKYHYKDKNCGCGKGLSPGLSEFQLMKQQYFFTNDPL